MDTPRVGRYSAYSARERHSRSVSGVCEDILNISPRLSYHGPATHFDRRPDYGKSFSFQEVTSGRISTTSSASSETPLTKSAAELVREISTLELEVIHLERHLLSLYRTAFDQYLVSSPTSVCYTSKPTAQCTAGSMGHDDELQKAHEKNDATNPDVLFDKAYLSKSFKRIEEDPFNFRHTEQSHVCYPNIVTGKTRYISGHRCLADHLGASIADHVPEICSKLSEDIVKCISAIYCKLASPPQIVELLDSPTPSMSSSSTFSPQDPGDNWSPKLHCETTARPSRYESYKDKNSPYSGMIEVPQICIDSERFKYASNKLSIFRSLIRCLETMDPRKMEHEEQLAFWINIHNALVMHAFLAYGLRENHIKSTYSILKAAYNVGGHSVNAYTIQSSILGCQPHRPSLHLSKLFATKLSSGKDKHPYALDSLEPLVHFALCSGSSSDPALRAYTAKSIYQDLEVAKAEFIQANVSVVKETKIILPKILQYYAKDACLELVDLLKMVYDYIPEAQRKSIQTCSKRRPDKYVEWSPYKSSFRYLVHTDLAKQ
ncbi:uncharacterized protein LOC104000224 isoform X1 [Musa acuminata AAA Group]|uniref:uncharacterized protein LOC104000224 isoform X1 n=1 Tax=Musa acuminata AAA Group TaxID=214697 RepID=UPI0031D6F4CA